MNIQAHSLVQQKATYDSPTKHRKKIQLIPSTNNSRSSGCRDNQVAIFKNFALECSKWKSNIFSEKKIHVIVQRIICLVNAICLTKVSFFPPAFNNVVRLPLILQPHDRRILPPRREEKQGSHSQLIRPCNFNRQCQICGLFQSVKRTSPICRDVNQILHRTGVDYATNLANFILIQDICIKLKSKRAPALACNTGMRPQWQAPIVKKQLQKAKKSIGSNAQAQ